MCQQCITFQQFRVILDTGTVYFLSADAFPISENS
jgi:hypothetical protein